MQQEARRQQEQAEVSRVPCPPHPGHLPGRLALPVGAAISYTHLFRPGPRDTSPSILASRASVSLGRLQVFCWEGTLC